MVVSREISVFLKIVFFSCILLFLGVKNVFAQCSGSCPNCTNACEDWPSGCQDGVCEEDTGWINCSCPPGMYPNESCCDWGPNGVFSCNQTPGAGEEPDHLVHPS